MMTLIFGFFGAALVGVATRLIDKTLEGEMLCRMMCHHPLHHGVYVDVDVLPVE